MKIRIHHVWIRLFIHSLAVVYAEIVNSDYNNGTESASTTPEINHNPTQDLGRVVRNSTLQDEPERVSETMDDNRDIVLNPEQITHDYYYETQPIHGEKEIDSHNKSKESTTGILTIVNLATTSPESIDATLTTEKSNTRNEHTIAVRNTTISYEYVDENNNIETQQMNQQENSQDGEFRHNDLTSTKMDNLTVTRKTTTKLKVKNIMDSDERTTDIMTDNHETTKPTGEPQPAIDLTIPNNATHIIDNSVLTYFDETDTSSATTNTYGDISADNLTKSDHDNTTTFTREISTNNISKPTIVATTNQASFPLDKHENATHAATTDIYKLPKKDDEPILTSDLATPIRSIFNNTVSASKNETETSTATTISSNYDFADNHTTTAYGNTTTLSQVTEFENISKPTVVAPANQAALPLDNHESAFNASIPEFNETESAKLNETKTEMLSAVNNPAISPEISVATSTAGTKSSSTEQTTAFSNTTTSYENLNEIKTFPELQDSKLNIQQEMVQDVDIVPSNSTTATNDNQIEIHATTTRINTTTVSDLAGNATFDKASVTHTMTTKANEPLPAIGQTISILANTIFDNSELSGQDENDTSTATTISSGSISANNHTTSEYENTATLSQVTATDINSTQTVVAPANQAAFPLDNHESTFNATISEFNGTESAESNGTKTEMLSAVNNPAISPEISVATSTADTTSSSTELTTAFQ